jgi:hypothetical protein
MLSWLELTNYIFTNNRATWRKEKASMESTVAALLLVTCTVVLSCVAIVYTVEMVEQSLSNDSPQMLLIDQIEQNLNQSYLFNCTLPMNPSPTPLP